MSVLMARPGLFRAAHVVWSGLVWSSPVTCSSSQSVPCPTTLPQSYHAMRKAPRQLFLSGERKQDAVKQRKGNEALNACYYQYRF